MWERVVNNELLRRGIDSIDKINIRCLSEAFNITLIYWCCSTRIIKYNNHYYCILDNRKNEIEQYEDFLHELAHIIFDDELRVTNNTKQFNYREWKVDYLVPLIAIPKFALDEISKYQTIEEIATAFNVTYKLAYKRIKRLEGDILAGLQRHKARDMVLSNNA